MKPPNVGRLQSVEVSPIQTLHGCFHHSDHSLSYWNGISPGRVAIPSFLGRWSAGSDDQEIYLYSTYITKLFCCAQYSGPDRSSLGVFQTLASDMCETLQDRVQTLMAKLINHSMIFSCIYLLHYSSYQVFARALHLWLH